MPSVGDEYRLAETWDGAQFIGDEDSFGSLLEMKTVLEV
jgi:hypothetical protein